MGPNGFPRFLGLFLVMGGVGALAYNLGVSAGLAQAGGGAVAAAPVVAPLAFGFLPFLFFGFLFKLLLIGLLIRLVLGFFWRGWGGPGSRWGDGRRFGGWGDGPRFGGSDASARFEEWHRRAHESTTHETTL